MSVYVSDPDFTLWHGDCIEVLAGMPAGSVDAVVTSPPYTDIRADVPAPRPAEFAAWFVGVAAAVAPVLAPAGSMLLNLGRRFLDGSELDYVEETLLALRSAGWLRVDTLIWSKTNPQGKGSPYLTNAHEYVYWLALQPNVYRGFDDTRTPYSPESLARFKRAPRTVAKFDTTVRRGAPPHPLGAKPWSVFCSPVGSDAGNPHPTPMAAALARHLVLLSCPPGGVVLDPFAGSGTTALAARDLGRIGLGIELNESYCAMAAARLGQQSLLAEVPA